MNELVNQPVVRIVASVNHCVYFKRESVKNTNEHAHTTNTFHFKWFFAAGPFEVTLHVLLDFKKPLCSIWMEGKHSVVRTGK